MNKRNGGVGRKKRERKSKKKNNYNYRQTITYKHFTNEILIL